MPEPVLVIACGALSREITEIKRRYGWRHLSLRCIDARLHNRPDRIPDAVRLAIRRYAAGFEHVYVAFADCGTGGRLDDVLAEEGVERLPGAHCYQSYAGRKQFAALADETPGSFYLTDFLARHFDRLVLRPLGLDEHPELRDAYFGNYTRLVYLSQSKVPALLHRAKQAAERLALEFVHVHCGYGELETELVERVSRWDDGEKDTRLLA